MVDSIISKQNKPTQQFPFERFASTNRYTDFDFLKKDNDWIMYIQTSMDSLTYGDITLI